MRFGIGKRLNREGESKSGGSGSPETFGHDEEHTCVSSEVVTVATKNAQTVEIQEDKGMRAPGVESLGNLSEA